MIGKLAIRTAAILATLLMSSCSNDRKPWNIQSDIFQVEPTHATLAPREQQQFRVDSWRGTPTFASWQQPQSILPARFVKLVLQQDF